MLIQKITENKEIVFNSISNPSKLDFDTVDLLITYSNKGKVIKKNINTRESMGNR